MKLTEIHLFLSTIGIAYIGVIVSFYLAISVFF